MRAALSRKLAVVATLALGIALLGGSQIFFGWVLSNRTGVLDNAFSAMGPSAYLDAGRVLRIEVTAELPVQLLVRTFQYPSGVTLYLEQTNSTRISIRFATPVSGTWDVTVDNAVDMPNVVTLYVAVEDRLPNILLAASGVAAILFGAVLILKGWDSAHSEGADTRLGNENMVAPGGREPLR